MGVLERLTFYTVLATLCLRICANEWLIYASVHDPEDKKNGLYSGLLDVDYNGTATNLSQDGVYCANMKSAGFYTGYMISSMGYDPITQKAVVQMQTHSFGRASVFTTRACGHGPPKCKNSDLDVIFAQAETKERNSNIGPFAIYNNSIYFIAHRYERVPARMIRHRIEIRKLEGCEDRQPYSMTNAFDIEACSSYITLVADELGDDLGYEMEDSLLVARQLYVTKLTGRLVFLTQIQNQTFNDNYDVEKFTMLLYAASETSPTKVLYEEMLPDAFAEHEIAHLGGIDYRDGLLCWTMLDRIFCADWDGEYDLQNMRTAVSSGSAAHVCSVKGKKFENMEYSNITTGVAIAKIENGDAMLVFGCYAREGRQGGAGVVTVTSDGKISKLLPLMDGNGKVYAGTVLIGCTNDFASNSPFHVTNIFVITVTLLLNLLVLGL